jgi:hypothetical protein
VTGAAAAAIGVAVLAVVVCCKIFSEHQKFAKVKEARAEICEQIKKLLPEQTPILPPALLSRVAGYGFLGSMTIVIVAALGTIAFCLAVICRHAA